ncbi:MAG: GNAT family N-acetyltransferase [Mucilaginibacter sp.]
MDHVLDNPGWNALISGNSNLANGNDDVKYFAKDVSPFVGFKHNTPQSFQTLFELVPHNGPLGFITPVETEIPQQWAVLQAIKSYQMVFDEAIEPAAVTAELKPLTTEHVPQMLALTKLTNPGPFAKKTIDFGHYQGIFDGDQLVAMAGQRLNIFNYAEISAVCTHPDYLGKGYARQLLLHHVHRIRAAGNIPFLHVRHDNHRAVNVYESLGFVARTYIWFYILRKNS